MSVRAPIPGDYHHRWGGILRITAVNAWFGGGGFVNARWLGSGVRFTIKRREWDGWAKDLTRLERPAA